MLRITSSGSFSNIEAFLNKARQPNIPRALRAAGKKGVAALVAATPKKSGLTASSWDYEIALSGGVYSIAWTNSDVENGFPVAIMLQYGHGTGTGGYVAGQDYINPAMRPIFDEIAQDVWRAVTS